MTLRTWFAKYPWVYAKKLASSYEIGAYLKTTARPKLNIGAQANVIDGWLNVDILPGLHRVYLDASDMAGLPDGSFDAVLCEHMIEHVPSLTGQAIIQSTYRVLKPGGVARFVTPDLERLARLIISPGAGELRYSTLLHDFLQDYGIRKRYPGLTSVDFVNIAFKEWGHQYLYTKDDLAAKLRAAGFSRVLETEASEAGDSVFEGVQGHPKVAGHELNNLEAFAFEVVK
jgi:predicted SAM-dependent methyltransferase